VTVRVGVVADTHYPEFLERLPARLFDVLRGVDLILHAGDVGGEEALAELRQIAPIEAVRGDHDRSLATLPVMREVIVEGKKIVIVHGNRSAWLEEPQTFLWTITLGYYEPHRGLPRTLRRRFPEADIIVFGHTHRPYVDTGGRTLVFNPGAVHQWTPQAAARRLDQKPGWFEWCWLQVARHIRRYPMPSVGMLEVSSSGIVPTVIRLS